MLSSAELKAMKDRCLHAKTVLAHSLTNEAGGIRTHRVKKKKEKKCGVEILHPRPQAPTPHPVPFFPQLSQPLSLSPAASQLSCRCRSVISSCDLTASVLTLDLLRSPSGHAARARQVECTYALRSEWESCVIGVRASCDLCDLVIGIFYIYIF